ncbi:hypothetical protein GCAAIG_08120 [Candidatus Electronema halotolerans]
MEVSFRLIEAFLSSRLYQNSGFRYFFKKAAFTRSIKRGQIYFFKKINLSPFAYQGQAEGFRLLPNT